MIDQARSSAFWLRLRGTEGSLDDGSVYSITYKTILSHLFLSSTVSQLGTLVVVEPVVGGCRYFVFFLFYKID